MDYEKLAAQFGGVVERPPGSIDYEKLAQQFGGVVEEEPQTAQPNFFEQNMPISTRIAKSLYGVAEAGTTMATGLASAVPAGIAGLGTLATGGGLDKAEDKIRRIQDRFTYQPRQYTGQKIIEGLNVPIEMANEGLGYVGEKVGGNIGQTIGENVIPVAATVVPGMQALKAAKASNAASILAKQKANVADAGKIDAANAAKKHGLILNPVDVNAQAGGKVLTGLAKQADINANMSAFNNAKLTSIAKRDLEIPKYEKLTSSAPFKAERQKAGLVYEDVKKVGTIPEQYTGEFVAKLNSLNNLEGMTPAASAYMKQNTPAILADFEQLSQNGFNATDIVNFSRKYRKEANIIYKKELTGGMSVEEAALADAKMGIANGLEDMISRYTADLAKANPKQYKSLATRWSDARTYIAKSHTWQNATDFNTGKIDAIALSKLTAKDNAITGTLKDVGTIAGNYPSAFQKQTVHKPLTTMEHFSRYGMGGMTGGIAGGGIGLAIGGPAGLIPGATTGMLLGGAVERGLQPLAMKRLMSEKYQQGMKVPSYYAAPAPAVRAMPDNKLHPDTVIPPNETGLSLAPRGSRLAPVQFEVNPPSTRGLIDFADEGVGKKSSRATEPFNQPDSIPFMLRQEFLQQPEISAPINAFVKEANRLRGLIEKSQGFWKGKYKNELNNLEQEFAAGMKQMGIRNAGEAHGLRIPLYEVPKDYRLPIKKQ